MKLNKLFAAYARLYPGKQYEISCAMHAASADAARMNLSEKALFELVESAILDAVDP